jgi:hypothetical protein
MPMLPISEKRQGLISRESGKQEANAQSRDLASPGSCRRGLYFVANYRY